MPLHLAGPYTLTIASSGSDSPGLSAQLTAGQMKLIRSMTAKLEITTPSALTGTVTLQSTPTEGGSSWTTVQINGTDVTIGASKTDIIPMGSFGDLRLHSSGSEASARDFVLNFQLLM